MNRALQNTPKTKRVAAVVLVLVLALAAAGCVDVPIAPYLPNEEFPAEFAGLIQGKAVYVTSIGQSPDLEVLSRAMKGVGIAHTKNSLLAADSVENGSVVFLVVGCSMKAMAEFDVTRASELKRAERFCGRASRGEITVVAWHLGGVARRGSVSDSLIKEVFQNCQLALFTADGNVEDADGNLNLSDWAISAGVPYCQISGNLPYILKNLYGETE
ncbi:MAG: DUF6305 family protein [Corallococcus sp.]|nr:DUF6305 family protein [Corallococcus sp.]